MGATSLALRAATLARGTLLFVLANHVSTLYAFTYPENFGNIRPYNHQKSALASTTETMTFEPIFDFSLNNTVESFERIDDAIMGGWRLKNRSKWARMPMDSTSTAVSQVTANQNAECGK